VTLDPVSENEQQRHRIVGVEVEHNLGLSRADPDAPGTGVVCRHGGVSVENRWLRLGTQGDFRIAALVSAAAGRGLTSAWRWI
jgi:hypothetical protein